MIKSLVFFIALFCFNSFPLWGWWDQGHMAIAQIAYEELEPSVRERVDRYILAIADPFPGHSDFITASTWADDITHDGLSAFRSWHGSAYPYDPEEILSPAETTKIIQNLENNDAVWAIYECIKTLSSSKATDWSKGFMLRMLIHIVADIHQPNHCITYYSKEFPTGDRAGTLFKIQDERYLTLHTLFDAAFGLNDHRSERPMNDYDRDQLEGLVNYLRGQYPRYSIPQLMEKEISTWRNESYKIGVEFVYSNISPKEKPSEVYCMKGKIVTGRQMAIAGYRLADLLNETFIPRPSAN